MKPEENAPRLPDPQIHPSKPKLKDSLKQADSSYQQARICLCVCVKKI